MAGEAVDICPWELKESNKSRFDSYSVRNSVLNISHITFRDCRVHIFSNNLSRNSCIQTSAYGLAIDMSLSNWLNSNEYVCPGEGYSLIWLIRGCRWTGYGFWPLYSKQGIYFSPWSVLNRVYNFLPVCPNYKQDEICLYSKYKKVMTITLNSLYCNCQ